MSVADPTRTRWLGLASALAGAVFVPYALSKGPLTAAILAEGWGLFGLSPDQTALLVHVAEEVPLVLMAAGLVALHGRLAPDGRLPTLALAVALSGFGLTVVFHLGEHLLAPVTVPALFGDTNVFVWGYYLGWLVLWGGVGTYGLAVARERAAPDWLPFLLIGVPPAALGTAAAVVLLDVYTVAGTLRVALGVLFVLLGGWLWRGPRATRTPGSPERVSDPGTENA